VRERTHAQLAIETETAWPDDRQSQEAAEIQHHCFSVIRTSPEELEVVYEAPRDEDVDENEQSRPASSQT
jgi:hypothetical protein